MNGYEVKVEAKNIASEAVKEIRSWGGDVQEQIQQTVDGHEWVIYYSQAWDLVSALRGYDQDLLDNAQEIIEDCGGAAGQSIQTQMTMIAYHVLESVALEESSPMIEALEALQDAEADLVSGKKDQDQAHAEWMAAGKSEATAQYNADRRIARAARGGKNWPKNMQAAQVAKAERERAGAVWATAEAEVVYNGTGEDLEEYSAALVDAEVEYSAAVGA